MRTLAIGLLVAAVSSARADDSAAAYRAHCAACHGEDGRADSLNARGLKVAPLQGYERLRGMQAPEIAALVRSNPKHAAVTHVEDAELLSAAAYVMQLVGKKP